MENVWDQTSVYAPRAIKDVSAMKVKYSAQKKKNDCQVHIANFSAITCAGLHHLARELSVRRSSTRLLLTPDVNECGFPGRPCSQRCVNTHGSYRCYCEAGYALGADGYTCSSE